MRPLSLILALAATAAGVTAVQAQDRYSARGVVFIPAPAAQAAPGQDPAAYGQAADAAPTPTRVAYVPTRLLRWPGKVDAPQPRVAPPQMSEPQAPAPQMAPPPAAAPAGAAPVAMAPARQRFASINSRPSTAPAPYVAPRVDAPVRQEPVRRVEAERPAPQRLAAETPIRRPAPQAAPERAPQPLPQSIYSAPPAPAPVAAAPAPVQTASLGAPAGGYPPATKEPWRRLLGPTPAQSPQGVSVPLPGPNRAAPVAGAAPAKATPGAKAAAGAKPAKKLAAAPAAKAPAELPAGYQTASAANTGSPTRFYSVHRQYGVASDRIVMPKQFFLDGSPDLSEPPPPPIRRIPPTSGQSTAQIRAAQARSQENPDAPAT